MRSGCLGPLFQTLSGEGEVFTPHLSHSHSVSGATPDRVYGVNGDIHENITSTTKGYNESSSGQIRRKMTGFISWRALGCENGFIGSALFNIIF